MSKYKTYGMFGNLYKAHFLQDSAFNVGNGPAYKYGYTFTMTDISSNSWECIGVPDDSNASQVMIDWTAAIYFSEDKGKTWTPFDKE